MQLLSRSLFLGSRLTSDSDRARNVHSFLLTSHNIRGWVRKPLLWLFKRNNSHLLENFPHPSKPTFRSCTITATDKSFFIRTWIGDLHVQESLGKLSPRHGLPPVLTSFDTLFRSGFRASIPQKPGNFGGPGISRRWCLRTSTPRTQASNAGTLLGRGPG